MVHFSCDMCGKDLTPSGSSHFVVKMEVFAATDPAELTDDDLEADHVEEMARLLSEMEDEGAGGPDLPPACQKLRYDLCAGCHRRFVKDPLGRETTSRLDFSQN